MKVILIRNIDPKEYGGAETYQIKFATILAKNNVTPIIVSSSTKLLKEAKNNHLQTKKAPFLKNQNWSSLRNFLLPIYLFWQIRLYFWYKKLFQKTKPTAVNIQSRDDWIAATLAAKKLNIKIFWTDHIDFRTWVFQNVHKKFKNPIGKYLLRLSKIPNKIIMISNFEYDYACKNIFLEKPKNLIVIKNGSIDQKTLFSGTKPEPQGFCYVGRLIDYKGINELISAFQIVSRDFPKAKLSIFGDGEIEDKEKYQKLARQNPNIKFFGYTKKPLEAIAKSQTFILPSYYEGMSLSLLDAIMMERTIIATNIDGNSEIIKNGKTGILVPAKNSTALAEAMLATLKAPKRSKELAFSARKDYEQNFNFELIIEKQLIPLLRTS